MPGFEGQISRVRFWRSNFWGWENSGVFLQSFFSIFRHIFPMTIHLYGKFAQEWMACWNYFNKICNKLDILRILWRKKIILKLPVPRFLGLNVRMILTKILRKWDDDILMVIKIKRPNYLKYFDAYSYSVSMSVLVTSSGCFTDASFFCKSVILAESFWIFRAK